MKKTTLRQAALKLALVAIALFAPLGLRAQTTQTFDFEDNAIPSAWTNDATHPWVVVSSSQGSGHSGTYCIKSGNSGVGGSSSTISATFTFNDDGTISFLGGCFGEGASTAWDKCIFSIDGTQQFAYGARQTWETYTFNVTAGEHTFTWSFTKDGSVNAAGDAFFVDDIVVDLGEVSACPKPSGLAATLTQGNGTIATLNWTAGGSETNWVVEYSTASDFSGATTVTTGFTTSGNSVSVDLTGLTAETPYYARVKADCGGGDESAWSSISFTPTNTFSLTVNDGTATTTNGYVPIYGYYVDNITKSQFIIPANALADMVDGTINKMTFYAEADKNWGNAQFEVYMTETNETTISALADYGTMEKVKNAGSLSISGNKMVVEFDAPYQYMGGNLMIGFLQTVTGTYSSCSWYGITATGASMGGYGNSIYQQNFLPKTTFEYESAGDFPKPRNLQVSNVTGYEATLTWETPNNATPTGYFYRYKRTTDANFNQPIDNGTSLSVTLNSLDPVTEYQFGVYANYADGVSDYKEISFTTLVSCPAPTAITDNSVTAHGATIQWNDMGSTGYNVRWQVSNTISEGFENGSLNDWNFVNSNSGNSGVTTNAAHNSNYGFKFNYDETNDASLISPVLSGTEDGVTISFYYKEESNTYGDEQFYVGYSTNETAEAPADFTYGNIVTASLNWQLYENSFPAGTKRIAIKYVYNDALALFIDDIDIVIPNDNWTTANTANTNYTITGLPAETRYLAQVQSVCGEDVSSWSEGVSFTTAIACPAPTTLAVAANAADATTMVDLTWTMNGAETDWQICINGDEENLVYVNESAVSINNNTVSYTLTDLIPGTDYTFKVRANCEASVTGDGTSDWSNTVSIQTEATCTEPTAFNHGTPDVHSVDLTWTESGTATQWQLCVNDDMDNLILLSSTDDDVNVDGQNVSYTLSGLTGMTNYSVKVRAYCAAGDGNQSPWVGPTEFRTDCEAITTFPWSENFESYAAGNFNDPCWVNEHISGNGAQIFKVTTSTNGNNTTHQLQLPDMNIGTLTKLVLPEMTLPNDNYQFVLDVYRSNSTYNDNYPNEGIRVYASTDGEIEGATELTFIPRQYNVSSTLIPQETAQGWYTYEIPIGISGTCYIILRGESQYCTSTYMDNFVVEVAPTCRKPKTPVCDSKTAHTATLSWTNGEEGQDAWQIAYSTVATFAPAADFTPGENEWLADVTSNPATIEELNQSTTYYAYVRANCGNGDYSDWSVANVNFTTISGKQMPTGLTVTNIASATATATWTGVTTNELHESYDLYYSKLSSMPETLNEDSLFTGVTTTTHDFANLESEVTYYVWVRDNCGTDGESDWTSTSFTTLPSCPTPTALAATNITNNAATISWTGSSDVDNYTVQYREAAGINTNGGLNENFNSLTTANSIPEGWSNDEGTTSTASHKWCYNTSTYGNGATNGTSHDDSKCVRFNSYTNSSNNTNFLQTPSMDFPAGETMMLSFWWKNPTAGDFSVYISTDGGTTKNPIAEGLTGQSTWTQATYELTDYVGASNVTIHFKGTSNYGNGDAYIYLDDIMVGYTVPAGEWHDATEDVAAESFTIEDLEAETKYDVQVKSNCTNGEYSAPYTFTTASLFPKEIEANKWYAIASPMHNDGNNETLAGVNNLTSGTYDLYGYNEGDGTWEKPTTSLNRGMGYIYRRSNDATLQFVGYANTGSVSVSLTSSCSDNDLKGFNLIGNPYPHAVAINQPHYTLNPNGTWTAHTSNNTIGVAEAFLVYSTYSSNTYYFSDVTPSTNTASASLAFTVSTGEYSDVAYARLEEGEGLPKIGHLNSEAPMLSIPVEGRRYAIANLGSDCQSFNLVFRGVNGTYTIKQSSNQAIAYCHLIDRVAGKDIDMLRQNYTFSSNGFDPDRFMVKLSPDAQENTNGNFAYWNGNNWMVEGNGTLQVFDALGRQLFSQEISNSNFEIQNSLFPAAGVYVLRMGEKTQKIVVR